MNDDRYPRCPNCPCAWHGLLCRGSNCACPTSYDDDLEETA